MLSRQSCQIRISNQIVHDTREGVSKVYGMTEDLIISVDEKEKRYQSYAMHDKDDDKICAEIFELLHRWPSAKSKNCEYGIWCLNTLLPDIVEAEATKKK